MPEVLKAVIIGLVQALTEFLPVSSSGHMVIAKIETAKQRRATRPLKALIRESTPTVTAIPKGSLSAQGRTSRLRPNMVHGTRTKSHVL